MPAMNRTETVAQQYTDDSKLSIRIALHAKYSTNPYGYTNWIFDQYHFFPGCRILELGCGNAGMWQGRFASLPPGSTLLLTDFSEGMVRLAAQRCAEYPAVSARQMDIQAIDTEDDSFDFVIANSMLYHVPDLPRAMREVHRVLKPGGMFCATTTGGQGLPQYLHRRLREFNPDIDAFSDASISFSLQNGADVLGACFGDICIVEYVDSLAVTDAADLAAFVRSTATISELEPRMLDGLEDFFERCKEADGVIRIPKQAGMFVAVK